MAWFSDLWRRLNTLEKFPHVGRNAPCPCGSGKKYKRCCLQRDEEHQLEELDTRFFGRHNGGYSGGGGGSSSGGGGGVAQAEVVGSLAPVVHSAAAAHRAAGE
jgi:hypothetical protein